MKIRTKLILLSVIFSISASLFTGLSIFTFKRINSVNRAITEGIELQVQSRNIHSLMKDMVFDLFVPKVYGQVKSLTFSPRTTVTVKKWRDSISEYQDSFDVFMKNRIELEITDEEILDQFTIAQKMHDQAMDRLDDLYVSVEMISKMLSTVEEDRFDRILTEDTFIPFFEEFRDTSYYFVDSFESFMNYFIEEFTEYGDTMERRIILIFLALSVCIISLGLALSLIFAKSISDKIDILRDLFRQVSKGNFSAFPKIKGTDELSGLALQIMDLSVELKRNIDVIFRLTNTLGVDQGISLEELYRIIVHSAVQETQVDCALIHIHDQQAKSPSKFERVSEAGNPGLIDENELQIYLQRFSEQDTEYNIPQDELISYFPDLSSLLILPLIIRSNRIGALTVAIGKPANPMSDLGSMRMKTYAEFSSLTVDNHMKYSELISKGEAEYQALQAQIQPHFIYNVLYGFIGLNRMGEKQLLEQSIIHLKNMLKYTQDSRTYAALSEEMSFVEDYCRLQQMRFQDRLNYSISISEDLEAVRIPRLLLQPLVENAVIHGLEGLEDRKGTLEITAVRKKGAVVISIVDNGLGFDTEDLTYKEHIGIGNVRKRLELAYPGSSFAIESTPGSGTLIRMVIHEMYCGR